MMEKELTLTWPEWPEDCAWPEPLLSDTSYTSDETASNADASKKSGKTGRTGKNGKNAKAAKADKVTEAAPTWTAEDYDLLREYVLSMLDVLHYYQDLVEEGWLDKNYRMTKEALLLSREDNGNDNWKPETGSEYWTDNRFNFKAWQRDFSANTKTLKLTNPNPVKDIENAIGGYVFINENLLRQAFTRRSFALEHGVGSSQELEFLGDTVLNTIVTREIIKRLTKVDNRNTKRPFLTDQVSVPNQTAKSSQQAKGSNQDIEDEEATEAGEVRKTAVNIINTQGGQATETRSLNEGDLTKLRSKFVNKEYLSLRAKALGLEKYILYGSKEESSVSALEDMMEALIGAVAIDTNWDWEILTEVVGRIINLQQQLDKTDSLLQASYFDLFNKWHQSRWGCMPKYSIHQEKAGFYCMIQYFVLDAYKEKHETSAGSKGETRSEAREKVAKYAYKCVEREGLLEKNIKRDSGITPDFETSINQVQELKQKKYIKDVEYYFFTDGEDGKEEGKENGKEDGKDCICSCFCGQAFESFNGFGKDKNKRKAKKLAAFDALNVLFASSEAGGSRGCSSSRGSRDISSKTLPNTSAAAEVANTAKANKATNISGKGGKKSDNNKKDSQDCTRLKILTFVKGTDSDIYRILSAPDNATLDDLCYYILEAFNFDHDHLYTFTAKGDIYICEEGDLDKPCTTDITLRELGLKKGDSLLLRYDFGDDWWFVINVVETMKADKADNSSEDFEVLQGQGEIQQYPDFE